MNELIQITRSTINGAEVNSVNARDLYKNLQLGQGQFQRWINKNLLDNPFFLDGVDYLGVRHNVEGNDVADYILSLDVAKHLSMMAKTEVAHKMRNYFIEVEKQSQKVLSIPEQIQLIAQGNQIIDERLTILEKTKKLEYWQERALQDAKNQTVYRIANDDDALAKKLHLKVWSLFKKKFHLPRYNELPAVAFEDGKSYILNLSLADMV